MRGVILAGGAGSRLYPATIAVNKQLLSLYGKPMIYYPLSTLMMLGIREIMIVTSPDDIGAFHRLLGDGNRLGLKIEYAVQEKPEGIAHAILVAEEFVRGQSFVLMLGDNVFYGKMDIMQQAVKQFKEGALILGYPVKDPERYGVIKFGDDNREIVDVVEKPDYSPSKYAVPGFYIYDKRCIEYVKQLKPSDRGELEITDLNRRYLKAGKLKTALLGRGIAWLDTGTPEALLDAETFIAAVETRQGMMIGCPEEVAIRKGFVNDAKAAKEMMQDVPEGRYKEYVRQVWWEVVAKKDCTGNARRRARQRNKGGDRNEAKGSRG